MDQKSTRTIRILLALHLDPFPGASSRTLSLRPQPILLHILVEKGSGEWNFDCVLW